MLDAKSSAIDMPIDSFQYILRLIITLGWMIHLVDLSDGVDSSHHIVLAVPIEPRVTVRWFMWSERKFLLVCCIIKASAEWLVTKNQACRCHLQMRRDLYGKQLRQWRISLGIFCFAIFKDSIFILAPSEDSFSLLSCLVFKAPGCVCPCSQGLGPQGFLWEGLTAGMCDLGGEAVDWTQAGRSPHLPLGKISGLNKKACPLC